MNLAYECVGKRLIIEENNNYSCYLILGVYKGKESGNWYCFYHKGNMKTDTIDTSPNPFPSNWVDIEGLDNFNFVNISKLKEFDKDTYIISNE
jgi:hypothetical protein